MKFGQSEQEAEQDTRKAASGDFIRYMKDGDTKIRILQEPEDWVYWWEHFQPGASFPCTNTPECPGCSSSDDSVKKVNRKVGFNVQEGEYINVYGVPPLLADKFKLRHARLGTICDRDYLVTRYKTGSGDRKKTEYDVESLGDRQVDLPALRAEMRNIEDMLASAYNEVWGDSNKVRAVRAAQEEAATSARLRERMSGGESNWPAQTEDPPSETSSENSPKAEVEVSESDLRKMDVDELTKLAVTELDRLPPRQCDTPDSIVDWMIEVSSTKV